MTTDTDKAIYTDKQVQQAEELKALEYCLQFARKTYDQETERQKSITNKADFLFKYLTLMTSAFSITVSVVSKMNNVPVSGIIFWSLYLPMLAAGALGLLSTLMIQRPRKIRQFPRGIDALAKVQQNPLQYSTDCKRVYQEILWIDKISDRLRENNNKTMKWMIAAYVSLAIMILIFGIFITYLINLG